MEFIFKSIEYWAVNAKNLASSTLLYWLVNNPKILNFSWDQGQTPGSSPLFLTIVVLSYLFSTFLLSHITLPSIRPSILRALTAIHNLILLTLSYTMALGCTLSIILHSHNMKYIFCYPMNTAPKGPDIFWAYVFYLSKIYEFMDTLLIFLRNSIKQLTFLHVYHHAMAVVVCYMSLQTSQWFTILATVNCIVHVIMYYYYFLCSIGIRPKWKRLVTICQILQFFFILFIMAAWIIYYYITGSTCSAAIRAWCFNLVFVTSLLFLFLDFYSKSYPKKNEGKKDI